MNFLSSIYVFRRFNPYRYLKASPDLLKARVLPLDMVPKIRKIHYLNFLQLLQKNTQNNSTLITSQNEYNVEGETAPLKEFTKHDANKRFQWSKISKFFTRLQLCFEKDDLTNQVANGKKKKNTRR